MLLISWYSWHSPEGDRFLEKLICGIPLTVCKPTDALLLSAWAILYPLFLFSNVLAWCTLTPFTCGWPSQPSGLQKFFNALSLINSAYLQCRSSIIMLSYPGEMLICMHRKLTGLVESHMYWTVDDLKIVPCSCKLNMACSFIMMSTQLSITKSVYSILFHSQNMWWSAVVAWEKFVISVFQDIAELV